MSATGSNRTKVTLSPGHSLLDWIRLTHTANDLTGVAGKFLEVAPEELAKHNRRDDAWISLKGKVYNVTPYMAFHPGGEDELMRGVGKDATDLFNQVHKWVNFEQMLEKCAIGRLVSPSPSAYTRKSSYSASVVPFFRRLLRPDQTVEALETSESSDGGVNKPKLTYEWNQDDATITVVITNQEKDPINEDGVVTEVAKENLRIRVLVNEHVYFIHADLQEGVYLDHSVSVNTDLKSLEVRLVKEKSGISWSSLGSFLPEHNTLVPLIEADDYFRPCSLVKKTPVTHDVYIFTFLVPSGTYIRVPIGWHVRLRGEVEGLELVKSYTPIFPSFNASESETIKSGKLIHLMIKIYPKGAFTPKLNALKIGDYIDLSDPVGEFESSRLIACHRLVLLAAGTGYTPMIRLIHWALRDKSIKKKPEVKIMSFNKKFKDIIWKDEMEALSKEISRFKVVNVLSEPDDSWNGPKGRIRKELLKDFIPAEDPEKPLLICICGPPMFMKTAEQCLKELSYSPASIHSFEG